MKDQSVSVIFLALLGVAVVMFGVNALAWHVAHGLCWWTFAAAWTGLGLAWSTVKAIFQVARNN